MAFTRFNAKPPQEKRSASVTTAMEAEKLIQIAVLLPATTIVGWFGGHWLDGHFNQHWMGVTGLLVGGVLGMVYVIRLVMNAYKQEDKGGDD